MKYIVSVYERDTNANYDEEFNSWDDTQEFINSIIHTQADITLRNEGGDSIWIY